MLDRVLDAVNTGPLNFTNATSSSLANELNTILTPLTPLGIHLVATLGILIGLFSVFFGKRCLKVTLFLVGFCLGFSVTALISHRSAADPQVLLVASSIVGVLVGLLTACIVRVAQAVVTIAAGTILILLFIRTGVFSPLDPGDDYIVYIILVSSIVVCMGLAYKAFDVLVVLVTSAGGSLVVVISFIHFLPQFHFNPIVLLADPTKIPRCSSTECLASFAVWGLLFFAGLFYQWRLWACDEEEEDEEDEEEEFEMVVADGTKKKSKNKRKSKSRRTSSASSSRGSQRLSVSSRTRRDSERRNRSSRSGSRSNRSSRSGSGRKNWLGKQKQSSRQYQPVNEPSYSGNV